MERGKKVDGVVRLEKPVLLELLYLSLCSVLALSALAQFEAYLG